MELRNRETGELITDSQLRSLHPNTSFPEVITSGIIDSFGYDPVLEGAQPTLIPPYEVAVRDGVEQINGQWFTRYIAGPVFTDYTDDEGVVHTAAEQWEAYCFQKDAEQAARVRADRNKRLADCDWTQCKDIPDAVSDAWATYRQELRDVPSQTGFPWDVQWPETP